MLTDIFLIKLEVFSYFLTFSQKSWFIVFIYFAISLKYFNFDSFLLSLRRLRVARLNRLNIIVDLRFTDDSDSSSWLFTLTIILG